MSRIQFLVTCSFITSFLFIYLPQSRAVDLPLTITYQGRLYDSSSNPIENTVDLQLDIYSQDGSCLLYSESKQLDLTSSSGFFSTQIGSVTGSSSRTSGVDPGLSMQTVFDNLAAKTGASSCAYTPSARDGRKIQVTIVKIGSTTVNTVLSPKQNITSVPYATVAQTLQGKGAESFVQLTGSITQSDFEGLMAKKSELLNLAGQETALLALANGTSTTYLKSSLSGTSLSSTGDITMSSGKSLQLGAFTNAEQTTLLSGLTSADVGKTWYNSSTNQVMYYDGSGAQAIGSSGGSGVSSVSGTVPIVVANGTSVPAISLSYGTGLTVTSNNLVPDFGTASGKVAQGNDARFNPTITGAGDAHKLVKVNSAGTAYEFVSTSALGIDSANSRVGVGTGSPSVSLDIGSKTDAVRLPSGTTAQRPSSAVNGDIRYNTTTNTLESYVNGGWQAMAAASSSVDNSSSQSIGGTKTFTSAATFNATGPSVALDVTGSGGLQTTVLNVTGNSTLAGNVNVNSGKFFVDATNAKVGIGTASPTNDLSLSGQAAKTVGMERHATADTAGNDLTLASGGAASGATDKNGGKLVLSSGTSTGTGASSIEFKTATAGSTGTSDNAPSTKMVVTGAGKVGIGASSPTASLQLNDAITDADFNASNSNPTQLLINDRPSATSGSYAAAQILMQPSPTSGTANFDGLKVNVNVPATSGAVVNYLEGLYSNVQYHGTGSISNGYGAFFTFRNNSAAAMSTAQGFYGNVRNTSTGSITYAYGTSASATNASTGSITNAYGGYFLASNSGAGSIGTAYGLRSAISNSNASGVITTAYGLYLNKSNSGTITNNYGIYQEDSSNNYFAGNIGIGTNAPGVALDASSKTDAIRLPAGTTAQRPTAAAGLLRYNSDDNVMEAYINGAWVAVATASNSVNLTSSQTIAGTKTYSDTTTFSATGPSAALDVTGAGGLQTTLLNVTGATTMAGNLNVNSGKFFVDATSGNIGIGTATPTASLTQKSSSESGGSNTLSIAAYSNTITLASAVTLNAGDILFTSTGARYAVNSSGTGTSFTMSSYIGATPVSGVTFTIERSSRVSLDSSGNQRITENAHVGSLVLGPPGSFASSIGGVHINSSGTTAPDAIRQLRLNRFVDSTGGSGMVFTKGRGTMTSPSVVQSGDIIGSIGFTGWAQNTSTTAYGAFSGAGIDALVEAAPVATGPIPTYLKISTTNTSGTYAERLRISADGNVGIGTSTPAYKLDVSGSIKADGVLSAMISSLTNTVSYDPSTASEVNGTTYKHMFTTPSEWSGYVRIYHSGNGMYHSAVDLFISSINQGDQNRVKVLSYRVRDSFYPMEIKLQARTANGYNNPTDWYVAINLPGNWYNASAISVTAAVQNISSIAQATTTNSNQTALTTDYNLDEYNWYSRSGASLLTIDSSGNLGVGTTSLNAKLQVSGSIKASGQIVSGSSSTTTGSIDWNNGNAITTSFNCANSANEVSFANLRDGGTYTLVVTGTGTSACNFNGTTTGADAGAVTYRFKPSNGSRTASSHTIYTLMRVGSIVYVSWASGF